tara:strand:- start:79 stop:603 length:525 start_codon:yes stop_codon:yes gene_type:complete
MKPPVPGWKAIKTKVPVHIPSIEGDQIAETIEVTVDAWVDEEGEIYLTGESEEKLDAVKARYMGLMSPQQIRELREMLGWTQQQISERLQLGAKTWTRWETGKERPSRSMNLMLNALMDGRIDATYLDSRHPNFMKCQTRIQPFRKRTLPRSFPTWQDDSTNPSPAYESTPVTT